MKRFVDMIVRFKEDGQIIPLQINWGPDQVYEIDSIIDIQRVASLKAGGIGLRYLCRIKGQERYIWHEGDRWFVEGRE